MKKAIYILLIGLFLVSCGPTDKQIQEAIEKTNAAIAEITQEVPAGELPTNTLIPTLTHTLAPTKTNIPTNTKMPTSTPIPTETPNPNVVKAGTYLVNDELKPGIYRGEGSCYWERLANLSGEFDAIIANDGPDGQFYVEVKESDFALSINCDLEPLVSLPKSVGEIPYVFDPGTYLVNRDIKPGIYRGDGSCYWERQKDVSGEFSAIIANDGPDGQFYVEVKESDFAFSTKCEIASLESLPEPTGELPGKLEPGIYLVGRDIKPGMYRGEGSCYWERLNNVGGGFDSILANDGPDGQFYVEVKESDFAFSTKCEIELVK